MRCFKHLILKMPNKISFSSFGHKNILSTQRNTLEFTKESGLSSEGDCIIGVMADFSLEKIRKFLSSLAPGHEIIITIRAGKISERVTAVPNPDFSSDSEIVVRRTGFLSERTLGIWADKSSKELSRALVSEMRSPNCRIEVTIEEGPPSKKEKIIKIPF